MLPRKTLLILMLLSLPLMTTSFDKNLIDAANGGEELSDSFIIQSATDFTVRDVDSGSTYALSDFRGTVVILDLFATWCPPCQISLPFLRQLHSQYSQSEVRIISVDVDGSESQSEVSEFRQEESMDWIVSLDQGGYINSVYGTGSVPTFYIIDQDGDIQWTDSGFSNEETKPAMSEAISYLLVEGPGPINPGVSDATQILITIAEIVGVLGIIVAAIFGYIKVKDRIKMKKCPTCSNTASSKCSKCGAFTCADCSTKGCKNCGSRQFIRM
ncbi:MAG: TlpA family protein disulfide reductase [Candidatus Heimdallarchaeota archaeon]|nr:TlpA family protein disulfide reductase [Candidatus Heimdallarchaeota archaeon]